MTATVTMSPFPSWAPSTATQDGRRARRAPRGRSAACPHRPVDGPGGGSADRRGVEQGRAHEHERQGAEADEGVVQGERPPQRGAGVDEVRRELGPHPAAYWSIPRTRSVSKRRCDTAWHQAGSPGRCMSTTAPHACLFASCFAPWPASGSASCTHVGPARRSGQHRTGFRTVPYQFVGDPEPAVRSVPVVCDRNPHGHRDREGQLCTATPSKSTPCSSAAASSSSSIPSTSPKSRPVTRTGGWAKARRGPPHHPHARPDPAPAASADTRKLADGRDILARPNKHLHATPVLWNSARSLTDRHSA